MTGLILLPLIVVLLCFSGAVILKTCTAPKMSSASFFLTVALNLLVATVLFALLAVVYGSDFYFGSAGDKLDWYLWVVTALSASSAIVWGPVVAVFGIFRSKRS